MQSDRKSTLPFLKEWIYHLRAAFVLLFITCNLAFWIIPLLIIVVFKWLLPVNPMQIRIYRMMAWIYRAAVQGNSWILFQIQKIRLDVEGVAKSYPDDFYLVIANHQSWSDILILQHLLNGKAPIIKFLVFYRW